MEILGLVEVCMVVGEGVCMNRFGSDVLLKTWVGMWLVIVSVLGVLRF